MLDRPAAATRRAVVVLAKGGKVAYRHVEPTALTRRKSGELLDKIGELKATGAI